MTTAEPSRIGRSEPRREDARLLRGAGRYAADVQPRNVLHVVFARSTMPRCKVVECDVDGALEMDGVVAAFRGKDVSHLGSLSIAPLLELEGGCKFPILADDSAIAVGQPIAAIVATSVNHGLDAIDALYADLEDDENTHETVAEFARSWTHGDVEDGFARADIVVEADVRHPRLAPSPIEPRAVTVEFDDQNDSAVVWLATQTPHRARSELSKILGVDSSRIHVIAPDVGGAFGMKASLYPEEVFVVWAAFALKRSLKWVATRNEDFLSATHGRGGTSKGELALTKDGKFLALRASLELPLGYWLPTSSAVPAWNAGRILPTGYRVDSMDVSTRARSQDRAAVGIYRGAGRPEANCLMERLVDEAAVAAGLDPIELRLSNLLGESQFPYQTPTGYELDSGRYREAVRDLCVKVDYAELKSRRDARRENGELVGLGIAFYVEPCGTGWESARVTLNPDGTVLAATGGSSQGHGRETAIAQIVSDRMGVAIDKISVLQGNTKECPNGIGALASRSTAIGGSAICRACDGILERVDNDLATKEPVTEEVVYEADGEAWGYGCYIVCVSIKRETGVLEVESAACMDDVGTIINPMLVEGQIMGGYAQGLGESLLEEVTYDDDDQLLTGSFTDYAMPRADDVPPLSIYKMSTPSSKNILGAKGVGEAGTIGTPAAILNAALDALRPLGIRDLQMPLTSQRLWAAINSVERGNQT